jgi:hypothetical protein
MKLFRDCLFAVLLVAGLARAAEAYPTSYNLALTFADGATFSGVVDFNNTLTAVTSLTGTLYGYEDGVLFYQGGGDTDSLSLLSPGMEMGPSLDGVVADDAPWMATIVVHQHPVSILEANILVLDFDLANPDRISLIDVGQLAGVDLVPQGALELSESSMTPTPESGSYLLAGMGLALGALVARRKRTPRI